MEYLKVSWPGSYVAMACCWTNSWLPSVWHSLHGWLPAGASHEHRSIWCTAVTRLAFSLLANINQRRVREIWLMSSSVCSHQLRFDSWIMPKLGMKMASETWLPDQSEYLNTCVCLFQCVWPVLFKPRCVSQLRVAVVKLVFPAAELEASLTHTQRHTQIMSRRAVIVLMWPVRCLSTNLIIRTTKPQHCP